MFNSSKFRNTLFGNKTKKHWNQASQNIQMESMRMRGNLSNLIVGDGA